MTLSSRLLSLDRIKINQEIQSKKKAIEFISHLFSEETPFSQQNILNCILSREKLGSTALNNGIAFPHGRIKDLVHPILTVITLKSGIDFDASDKLSVDIIIGLLVSEDNNQEHLDILAAIAKFFNSLENNDKVRSAQSSEDIFEMLTSIFL
jgi:PTS system nitrogen regulatory IIA component